MNLVENRYDYGCVMANLDEEDTKKIVKFNQDIIPDDIVFHSEGDSTYGREIKPHITIKYGLINSYTKPQMRRILRNTTPFTIRINGISLFENTEYDVIKFDVDSPELRRLNELFSRLPNHDSHADMYRPHITLAYVKPSMAKKYVKSPSKGAVLKVKTIEYSDKGEKTYYKL
jgi:2'-5' RNA ligase